ncbi:mitogen-activated protein kinase kinase kinase 5 [Argentina anserina]|uniref:mitogen-activated protein kinase kinase kinase 5 n=1 Tax=Argentina anserina TaxID=57926 RepID=UPI00217660F2|nr:mitogen-activated protein kinase kinase kinase 5 [Potentilla anserina]
MLDITMRWFASSSSSSAPSSSSSPKKKSRVDSGWMFRSRRKASQQQRKLLNVGRDYDGVSKSSSASGSESALASPQPLPLPESANRRGGRCSRCSSLGHEQCFPSPAPSVFSCQDNPKNNNQVRETVSSRRNNRDRNRLQIGEYDFSLDFPVRSAPTSPCASPRLCGHRPTVADFGAPPGNQVWSAPGMTVNDMTQPPHALPDVFSNESSPINSPTGRSPLRQPQGSSPLHPRLSVTSEVYPLPLPPGASLPSPSVPSPQPALTPKQESQPIKGQWQKGKLIGRGTFGSVYVATNRETGALCAMKEVELLPDDPKSAECIKQLQQEIKVLSQLKHPNIVQYYGSEIVEDRFFIYLEYVHPGSINKYVHEHCGAMTEAVVRSFTRHILSGLAYLHGTKTIHRDIKGANMLVDSFGVVKLADFGMAKHLSGHVGNLSLKGSPYWMAPELMQSEMHKDNSSDLALAVDIWSLGCTIIEMFTGKPPWSQYEGAAAMFKVIKDTPPVPETLSPEGKDFLRCCFQRNPADRSTAAMLLEHRFVKSSQPQEVPSTNYASTGMNLMEGAQAPTELERKLSSSLMTPNIGTRLTMGKAAL